MGTERQADCVHRGRSGAERARTRAARTSPGTLVITRFQFKEDGRDYLTDRWQHLYLLDVESSAVTLLTPGAHDEWLPAWSPDGEVHLVRQQAAGDIDRSLNFDIWIMSPVPGAEPRVSAPSTATTVTGTGSRDRSGQRIAASWSG